MKIKIVAKISYMLVNLGLNDEWNDERNDFSLKQVASEKNHSVYKIDCINCVSSYIGETSKKVEDRVKEHRRNIITGMNSPKFTNMYEILATILISQCFGVITVQKRKHEKTIRSLL